MVIRKVLVVVWFGAQLSCVPESDDRLSRVVSPRVIAVSATPAEVAPGKAFTLDSLRVDGSGDAPSQRLTWAICTERKPLTELGAANPRCIDPDRAATIGLRSGASTEGVVPEDACRLFGPLAPEPKPGEPSGRPVDPDATGGYFLPIQLIDRDAGQSPSLVFLRISCGLGGVTPDVSAEYGRRYKANENPAISKLTIVRDDGEIELARVAQNSPATDATVVEVSPSTRVILRATWASSCVEGEPCTGAERYVWLDPTSRQLTSRRESIRASWFSTAGELDVDRTGRDESDLASTTDNGFVTPSNEGDVHVWLVLRDDRGGSSFTRHVIRVSK